MIVQRGGAERVVAQGVLLIDVVGELDAQRVYQKMQVGVADAVDLRLGRGRDHYKIVIGEAARLDLIRRAQQVDINLKAASQIAAGGVARVGVGLKNRIHNRCVILLDYLIIEGLR